MKEIKAVLFDLDNTILDRTRMFGGFAHAFLDAHFGHVGDKQGLHARIMELDRDGYNPRETLFAELLDELPWERKPSLEELAAYYWDHFLQHAVLMERAREVLAHARAKYRTGLITNGRMKTQYGKIDRLGIRDAFELILISEEAGVKKPDPRIFALAADRLGLRPEECLFIGDHPANDVDGAARFGMATIWLRSGRPWPDGLAAVPLHTIDRLDELLALL
ncbi:HAD family hydrolase [Paenibacillus sacheonensis]|uniref:HAD-IA family hydrolase n=1 Tax=Paenibacillus sacheonensis TaxID=742054 RepID=A0A7X5BWC9_9BACL|nr:HAD family hydrolase [Paenibacillus sacheonensis]MBM7564766.1 putative hydrolase of the HAD superfamily [Paenibacillus sacheonensis]NBC69318.1 HAD-IA family hydrolase [Paenibacillus sacheonensis]